MKNIPIHKRLRYWLTGGKKRPQAAFPNTTHVIKYAFTSGGVDYFMMDDIFNMPWQRAMEASHAYEELQMRCDRKYLMAHHAMIHELLTGTKFGLEEAMKVKKANDQLKQRLDWVVVPDQAFKLASIVFFDISENPQKYEVKYGREKIAKWKENEDVEAFFLQLPVKTLMPFLDGFEGSFQNYSEVIKKVNRQHLQNLSTKFSDKPVSSYTVSQ